MYSKIAKFFLFATPFTVAIVSTSTLFPFIVGKYVFFRTSVALALIFFLLALIFDERGPEIGARFIRAAKSPLGIAIATFVVLFLLAGFLGVNPRMSFWSNFERGEGGLQMLHLFALFLLMSTLLERKEDWRKLFQLTMGAATLMIVYGILAGLKSIGAGSVLLYRFIGQTFGEDGYRFSGSIGNPSYVAAYLLFVIGFTAYTILADKGSLKGKHAIARWAVVIFFFVFFFLAATRGAFLGLLAATLVFIGYLAYSLPAGKQAGRARVWLGSAAAAMVLAVLLLVQFKDVPAVRALPFARLFDISFSAETFGHRRLMWRIAIDGWKERPLLGWGPENYLQVFDRHFDTRYYDPANQFGAWFDRAHSIIFDYLVEIGILGLLAYLSIFLALFYMIWRGEPASVGELSSRRRTLVKALCFAIPVAYLVQGLILFDVLTIHLVLFTFFAFAWHEFGNNTKKTHA